MVTSQSPLRVLLCALVLLSIGTLFSTQSHAQILTRFYFEQEWGIDPDVNESANDVVYTSDFGYAVVSTNEATAFGSDGLTVAVINQNGTQRWTRRYTRDIVSKGIAIIEADDGDLVVVGFEEEESVGIIIKIDPTNGNTVWNRYFNLFGNDCALTTPGHHIEARELAQIPGTNGDFIVVGSTKGNGNEDGDNIYLGRFDFTTGVAVWQRSFTCINDDRCTNLVQEGLDLDLQGNTIRVLGSTEYEASQTLIRTDIVFLEFSLAGAYTSGRRLILQQTTDPLNSYPKAMWADDPAANGAEVVFVGQIESTDQSNPPLGGFILRRMSGTWTAQQIVSPNQNDNTVIAMDIERSSAVNFGICGVTSHANQTPVAFLAHVVPSNNWAINSRTFGHYRDASSFNGIDFQPALFFFPHMIWDQGYIAVGALDEANGSSTNSYAVKTDFQLLQSETACSTDVGVSLDDLDVSDEAIDMGEICDFENFSEPRDDPYVDIVEICFRRDNSPFEKQSLVGEELSIEPSNASIQSYPNPVVRNQVLRIRIPNEHRIALELRISDMYGREVYRSDSRSEAMIEWDIDNRKWSAGTYFVQVSGSGVKHSTRIVVIE